MLKFARTSLALITAITATSLYSHSAFASEKSLNDVKVAIVDVQSAILQTNEGKASRQKIESEMAPKRKDLLNQQGELKKLQEDFNAQQSVLSDADKQTKQKEFQTKFQAFHQAELNFEQESRQKEAEALQKILKNIQSEVQKIAKEKKFDMVFDKSAAVLLYSNNTTDITTQVVSLYNNEFKNKSSK